MKSSLVTALTVLLIGGGTVSASAAELSGTLQRIDETGTITLGYRSTTPPMAFLDGSGAPVGYSMDLCAAVAEETSTVLGRTDLSVAYVPVTAANRFDALAAGEIDILCGATTRTLARQDVVDFTQLTFVTGAGLMGTEDGVVDDLANFEGKRIAAVADTTTIDVVRQALDDAGVGAEVVGVSALGDGIDMMKRGEVAAVAADQVVLIGQIIVRNEGTGYYLSKDLLSFEPFALAVAKGDADFKLVADRALSRLSRTGEISEIYSRWFGRFSKAPPELLQALYKLGATPE